ncbi:uncharacterized protein [Haliotis cracherodii]|uniref:uncharacterized protein n=1 Tax=Haliotis cracherodii TaxID=6455 RepID=UPI0039EB6739
MTTIYCLVILCCVQVIQGDDSTAIPEAKTNETGVSQINVRLKPPANLTAMYVSSTNIFIEWDAPDVYPLHEVDDNVTTEYSRDVSYWNKTHIVNETVTATLEPPTGNVSTVQVEVPTPVNASSKGDKPGGSKLLAYKPKCLSQEAFKSIDTMEHMVKTVNDIVNYVNNKMDSNSSDSRDLMVHVPFDQGCVEKYVVNYVKKEDGQVVMTLDVAANQTEYNITNLEHGTTYSIFISAHFTSGDVLNSTSIEETTPTNISNTKCRCSLFGSVRNSSCDYASGRMCQCNPQYTGSFCEICRPGYYRSAPYFPCNRCPCSPLATNSPTCYYREGYLVCNACKPHYTGHLCQSCINGYYRYHGQCVPCHCNGNNNPAANRVCDPYTGACTHCAYNTTGFNCEKCLPGFVRNKTQDRHCILYHESASARAAGPSKALIAGICIAVILALCAVVGFAVYRRWKIFPPRKPFWTVELKEDHDGVNFSAVPGHEYQQHNPADVQDLEFYEKHRGKSSGKSVSSYSQLREDI